MMKTYKSPTIVKTYSLHTMHTETMIPVADAWNFDCNCSWANRSDGWAQCG